jgi:apolipoprotein D and lipocalin family protein
MNQNVLLSPTTLLFVLASFGSLSAQSFSPVPVKNFSLDKYLGTWYEIVRMPVVFEKGLSKVTANYSLSDKGRVIVLNRGIKDKNGEESVAKGKAKFASENTTGHLKVSFFGPFYADYIIVELDSAYTYAMVVGNSTRYLWILSRTPAFDKTILDGLLKKAAALGYKTDQFIFTAQ